VHGKRITIQPKNIKLARRIRGDRDEGERVGSEAYNNSQSFKNLPVANKDWKNPKARKREEEREAEKPRKKAQEKAEAAAGAAAEKAKQEEAGRSARQAEVKAREREKEREGEEGVKKAPKALQEIDKAWGKRATNGWKEIFTQAEWDEAWGLLKQVHPDVKKIAVWTQHGHKVEDGDHFASVSLKQEGGIRRLVITVGDDGVPVAGHPGFGKEEEEEEGNIDDDGSDSSFGSESKSSGSNSEDPSGEEGDGRGEERRDSRVPAGEEGSGLATEEKNKSSRSAVESRQRRGAVNGDDEPPAQKPKLTNRGGKGGGTASDGAGTPRIHAKGPIQVSEEASTKGGKKGKVGKGNSGGEGSRRAGGGNK
jgi:hypothetical protein